MASDPIGVLVAGIGSSSLGIEIFKALRHAGGYRVVGTDVDPDSFGLFEDGFTHTQVVPPSGDEAYAATLLNVCREHRLEAIAPGAQAVHRILSDHRQMFAAEGIMPMLNSDEVVRICSDKTFNLNFLRKRGFSTPATLDLNTEDDLNDFDCYPCVVKPASNAGGSNLVFLAEDRDEAAFFTKYLRRRDCEVSLQQYIASDDEFTVGVCSDQEGNILGSIALRRLLGPKLSFMMRYDDRVISSGWSQGEIDVFEPVCEQAEAIAKALDSRWALNIQGRLAADGVFYPFEINPRHSGTTFLRTLAGFNEPHILLQKHLRGIEIEPDPVRRGLYLRAFRERFVLPREQRGDSALSFAEEAT